MRSIDIIKIYQNIWQINRYIIGQSLNDHDDI